MDGAKSGRRMFMHAAPRSHTGLVSRELGADPVVTSHVTRGKASPAGQTSTTQ